MSTELLANFEAESEGLLQRIVTDEETWVHHCDPQNERQFVEYHHKGSPVPRKVMLAVFFNSECVVITDFL